MYIYIYIYTGFFLLGGWGRLLLISYSLDTQVMLIFILIHVQYSQKAVSSFVKGLNRQNHSSSGLLHLVKKLPPVKFPIPPNPLTLFRRPQYIKLYVPFLCMVCNCLKAMQSHYEETVYFLPEIPDTH